MDANIGTWNPDWPSTRTDFWDLLVSTRSLATDWDGGYPTGEDLCDVFAQVLTQSLIASSAGGKFPALDFQWCFKCYFIMALEERRAAGEDFTALRNEWYSEYSKLEGRTKNHPASAEFYHRVINVGIGRKPFRTQQGYIGLGPFILRPGDVVCVFYGSRVPFILRPVGDRFQFLGECYLHGIMNGEALSDGRNMSQTFQIL
jgi:hypothetical protein